MDTKTIQRRYDLDWLRVISILLVFFKYAGEVVMGFYILHQTILLVIGYFVLRWAIPDLAKWAIISISSLFIIMMVYEYAVRRVNVLRFLFGMKLVKRHPTSQPLEAKVIRTV